MTVETSVRKESFAGGQDDLTFSFKTLPDHPEYIKAKKILIASGAETDLTYSSDYTVAVSSDGVGGTVTLTPSVSTAYTVTVYRDTTDKQESDYDDYNQFPADTLEEDLDRRTLISQERSDETDRALKMSITYTGSSITIPNAEANKLLGWNSGATAIENKVAIDADTATLCANYATTASTEAIASASSATVALNAAASIPSDVVIGDGTVNPTNLLYNGNFENWSAGTSAAPDGWTLGGANAVAVREGNTVKLGSYSASLTRVGADCFIYQYVSSHPYAYWTGRKISVGCWVYATVANRARIQCTDGGNVAYSAYHTGDSTWQWLSASGTVTDATQGFGLQYRLCVDGGNTTAYFDGAMCTEGDAVWAFSERPMRFVNRGDPSDWDFTSGDFTCDGSFHDLDLSSIVPSNATAVHLYSIIKSATVPAAFNVRKNGISNATNAPGISNQVANVDYYGNFIVSCDSDQVVEYKCTNGVTFTTLTLSVIGWFE